ncbi:MAG: hypothetical protein Q4E54_08495, partial [Lachnospiraceae bacterium]|nr:hypothetical protein [Lachnospiraceae bacterium]
MWSAWWKYKESIIEIIDFTCFCDFQKFDACGIGRKKALVKEVKVVVAIRNDVRGNTIKEVDMDYIDGGTCL